jgi:hypothetical protein
MTCSGEIGDPHTECNCLGKLENEEVTTCADPTRILEHDEQTPPKFWCHKPQDQLDHHALTER